MLLPLPPDVNVLFLKAVGGRKGGGGWSFFYFAHVSRIQCIISVHHTVTHQDYLDMESDDDNAIQHFWLMVTKKFFRGTFESGILIITNNNNSSSNRSSNNHNNSNDISINSLILPPGGFDGPQQTLFGRQRFGLGIFGATPQMMKKNLLITFLFLFFH